MISKEKESWCPPIINFAVKTARPEILGVFSPSVLEFHSSISDISVGKKLGRHLLFVRTPKQKSCIYYKVLCTNLYNLPALYPKTQCPTGHQLGCQSIHKPILRAFCKSMWRGGEAGEESFPIWCLSLNSKVTYLCLCIKRNDFMSSPSFKKRQNSTM